MATKVGKQESVSAKLIERWEGIGAKLAGLAEAIPESKFEYRPANDVRSMSEILRHAAYWNQYLAQTALGKEGDDSANELPHEKFSTKADVTKALRKSVREATEALKRDTSGLSADMTETLVTFIEHNCEHYGQLVVYARLNGIVPPSSRG